jgi:hypothetical protein
VLVITSSIDIESDAAVSLAVVVFAVRVVLAVVPRIAVAYCALILGAGAVARNGWLAVVVLGMAVLD